METGILFVLVLGLLFLGVPVAVSLGLSSIIVIAFFSNDSMSSVAQQLFTASQNYTLLAIPFFIFAGDLMMRGGIAARIIAFAGAVVGKRVKSFIVPGFSSGERCYTFGLSGHASTGPNKTEFQQ